MEKLGPAIQAARVKLNSCSELSQNGRDDDARAVALEVRKTIDSSLLQDAEKLASAGTGTQALQDVRVLQCAALLAQALAVQKNLPEQASSSAQAEAGSLYGEAKEVAMSFLPLIHPMVALTRSLFRESGVSASSGAVRLPALSPKKKEPRSPTSSNPSPSNYQQLPKTLAEMPPDAAPEQQAVDPLRAASPAPSQGAGSERAVKMDDDAEVIGEASKERRDMQNASKQSSLSPFEDDDEYHDHDHIPRVPRNIFKEYIEDYKMEIEMSKPWFKCKEDENRKKIEEKARFTRLQNKGKDRNELSNPKYTALGHKIQGRQLAKLNQSRSDPTLMQAVKMNGVASPEAFMTSKLRLTLDPTAKPMAMPKRKKRIAEE